MSMPIDRLVRTRRRVAASSALSALSALALAFLIAASSAQAQSGGDDPDEDWSSPSAAPAKHPASRAVSRQSDAVGWSFQTGIGFTADPETFLLNFEAPYAFNEWISAGPMLQVGLEKDHTIVAPAGNLRLTVPDLPGRAFDRLHPYVFGGMGFAYLEKDKGRNDGDGVGFLVDTGFGVEYQVSQKVFLGSQMMFNFLPKETKNEGFYYAWQIAGIRFAF